jgi:hypothetical protein
MKTYGIEKTTVRLTVILPDNYARVQRLYDYGAWFKLAEETIDNVDKIADFINNIKARGGKLIHQNEFIDDDDFKTKQSFTYELID